ncbi:MAG: ATP-binding protein [Lachnospiraceae bacterium]|nr:ATP-binding protein [Lachnospiraceae bacterium]
MKIIGRKRECNEIERCVLSKRPEFVVVYGRRRVGKTYLIKEFFKRQFAFYATGVTDEKTAGQLRAFHTSLKEYGDTEKTIPKDWYEAFGRLKKLLCDPAVRREPVNNKIVVFLDELPWMDTARSDFKSALDYFWNTWGSSCEDLLLIVCGSATSWIIDNLLEGKKGFHNRVTRRIRLLPFCLKECKELLEHNGVSLPESQIIDCYMAFGGIPFYLNMLDPRLSVSQNIDELYFKEYGDLHNEYHILFNSLYKNPEKYTAILKELSSRKCGMTRNELASVNEIGGGDGLTKRLRELCECGFIRKYRNFTKAKNDAIYQLIDPFVAFHHNFGPDNKALSSWLKYINTPGYNAWRGNAFEMVVLNHVIEIKKALGVSGVESEEYAWKSENIKPGSQIDLLIDRSDGVVNLCEIKYSNDPYEITAEEFKNLQRRSTAFQNETGTKKSIHITLVAVNGLKKNKYAGIAMNTITGEELFG